MTRARNGGRGDGGRRGETSGGCVLVSELTKIYGAITLRHAIFAGTRCPTHSFKSGSLHVACLPIGMLRPFIPEWSSKAPWPPPKHTV